MDNESENAICTSKTNRWQNVIEYREITCEGNDQWTNFWRKASGTKRNNMNSKRPNEISEYK